MRHNICLILLLILIPLTACMAKAPTVMEFTRRQAEPADFTMDKALYVNGDTKKTTLTATLEFTGEEVTLRIVRDADGQVFWQNTATSNSRPATIRLTDLTEGDYSLQIEATATETLYLKLTSPDKFMEPRDKPDPEPRETPGKPEKPE